MPRYSADPKDTTVKLRLSVEMKNHLDNKAKSNGITISEYIRKLIQFDMAKRVM